VARWPPPTGRTATVATPLLPPSDNGSGHPSELDLEHAEALIDAEQQEQAR